MTAAYSLDLREKIIQAKLSGKYTISAIAEMFSVGLSSVAKYYKQYLETGSLEANKQSGRPPKILESDKILIQQYVLEVPDASLQSYCDMLAANTGKTTCISNMHSILSELGFSRKKKVFMPRNRIVKTFNKPGKIL